MVFHNLVHLPITSDASHASVIHIAHFNTTAGCTCMDDLIITYVDTNMAIVAYHITGLLV